jgi:8-oxo-dGTP pyrophosphatase MutT (NUDIX family)
MSYKAAAIIFYRIMYVKTLDVKKIQVYLQYEHAHNMWSHFGGKREPYENNPWDTALRELNEEATVNIPLSSANITHKLYFYKSKMIVHYVFISEYDYHADEAQWMCIDFLPSNIRKHVIEQIEILSDIPLHL